MARFLSRSRTSQGAAVEQLLEAGMIVYPLNPKSAQAYRERKAPSGVKDDRLDAWSFADALRVDGQDWKALRPEEPLSKNCVYSVGMKSPSSNNAPLLLASCAMPWQNITPPH
jgi:hypothetical protein